MKTTKFYHFKTLILTGFVFISSLAYASKKSDAVITGRVLDSNKKALNYATALLIQPETMKIITGDMCDSKGNFIIENVKPGKYILTVRMLGYAKIEIKNIEITAEKKIVSLATIAMNESHESLRELEVIAFRKNNNTDVIL